MCMLTHFFYLAEQTEVANWNLIHFKKCLKKYETFYNKINNNILENQSFFILACNTVVLRMQLCSFYKTSA